MKNTLDNEASSFSNGSSSTLNKETEDTTVTTNDEKPLFTFGQNLSARVVFDSGTSSTPSKAAELKTASEINSTSDNLFSFSDNYDKLKDASVDSNQPEDLGKSENDAESKNGESSDGVFKRKYEVITGEEGICLLLTCVQATNDTFVWIRRAKCPLYSWQIVRLGYRQC